MTQTFADYVATQDARNTIELNVRKWTLMLCEALQDNFIEDSIKRQQFFGASDYSNCLLYTSPSPRDQRGSRMPSSA